MKSSVDLHCTSQAWLYSVDETSHLLRLWHFSSSINSFFENAHAQPSSGARCLILVEPFVHFHTSCVRTAKAVARLRGCAGSPGPLLVAYVIVTVSCAGSYVVNVQRVAKKRKRP